MLFRSLGFVIHKEAKDFARKYAPIKENYTRYATAINDLQESIKKGDVNEAYSTLFPAYMVRGYKGFELDANGRVKAGTMFSAPTAVKDPKIMEKLQARLAILKPETFKSKITGYTGEGNMYKFTTEDEVIKIDKADVQDVIDAVLSEPDVKAYVNQFADMKTYAATKDQGAMATVQSMADNYSNVLAELNTKLDDPSLKSQERIQIKNQIEALTAELKQTTEVSKDEQTAYNYIKHKNEDAILAPYQSYGEKAIMQSESHSRSKEFSEQYLKDQEWKLANQGLMVQGKISLADRNGATLDEKATNMRNAWAAAYALEQKLNDPKYTATLSEESLNELKRELKSTKDQALLIQQQMFTAANTVITENDIVKASPDAWKTYTAFKELYPWAKPGEIYIRMQETFADKNGQDYANFQNKYKEKYGGQYTGYAPGDKQHPKVTAAEYRQKYAPGSGSEVTGVFGGQPNPKMVEFFKNNPDGIYEGSVFEEFAPEGAPNYPSSDDIGGDLSQVLKNKFNDKINSQFKEIKIGRAHV